MKCVQIGLDFGLHSVASHLMCGAKMLFSNQMMFGWFSTNALQMIRSRFSAHEPCTGPVSSRAQVKVLIVHVFIIPNGNILFRDIFKNDADDVPSSVMILICVWRTPTPAHG